MGHHELEAIRSLVADESLAHDASLVLRIHRHLEHQRKSSTAIQRGEHRRRVRHARGPMKGADGYVG